MMILKKILKNSYTYLLLVLICLYHNVFFTFLGHISGLFLPRESLTSAEIAILEAQIEQLKKDNQDLADIEAYANYDYDLTRLIFRSSYLTNDMVILGGENKKYQKNYAIVNNYGLVGIIEDVYPNYSKVKLLPSITNLSVQINDSYGTLMGYEDGLFVIGDISNYDVISLNDVVYTSTLGVIKEKIKIGTVMRIDNYATEKKIYIKSPVNFNKINYFYVVGSL